MSAPKASAQGGLVYAIYNQEVADRLNLEEKFADEYARCLEDGVFFKADTLEEVAEHYGINAENLVETMDKYNEGIENNTDEFGRTTSMVTMKEGPWFILEGVVSVHHTMGRALKSTKTLKFWIPKAALCQVCSPRVKSPAAFMATTASAPARSPISPSSDGLPGRNAAAAE